MTKARKVKSSSKAAKAPARKAPQRKIGKDRKPAPKIHKYTGRSKSAPAEPEAPAAPRGIAARLAAAAAAASAGDDEPVIAARKPTPKGGVQWEDMDDLDDEPAGATSPAAKKAESEPVLVAPPIAPKAAGDGLEVVAKGASKFSAADIEMLRASIKVKGSVQVVEGINLDELKWDGEGLVPCVAQDRRTGAVLMLAHMNRDTLTQTLRTKQMTYWSRSRNKVWVKGEESGHAQRLVKLTVDCDKDAILAIVDQEGPACHRDTGTCWNETRTVPIATFLGDLDRLIEGYQKKPEAGSHTSKLLAEPIEALRKFVEEANEVTRVLQGKPNKDPLEHEAADVLYHLLVACRTKGVGLEKIVTELFARHMAAQLKHE